MRLEGKVALITGGGTGIGLEIARQYVAEGAYVYITGRRGGSGGCGCGWSAPGTRRATDVFCSRGNRLGWTNQVVAWSQLELIKYNVPAIMKDMQKPYLVVTAENAWSRHSSEEVFAAVPDGDKQMAVIPVASHFDMYDLAPFVDQAFEAIAPFFARTL